MGAKNSFVTAIYNCEGHKVREKAACPCRDESSKRMCADERMQNLQVGFLECNWQIHKRLGMAVTTTHPYLESNGTRLQNADKLGFGRASLPVTDEARLRGCVGLLGPN